METKEFGAYSELIVTDISADTSCPIFQQYNSTIPDFLGQAVYVYSFKEQKMLFARGWKEVLGFEDNEISLLKIISRSSDRHRAFSAEINKKSLQFLATKKTDLEKYSFTIEVEKIHKEGHLVPLFSRVAIYKAPNGIIEEIIGVSQVMPSLKFGNVMQYATYGPDNDGFDETLSQELFQHLAISKKEKEALVLAADGYAFKEIAHKLNVSQSAIEKRILPLYKRFSVTGLPHLINFAHENHIL